MDDLTKELWRGVLDGGPEPEPVCGMTAAVVESPLSVGARAAGGTCSRLGGWVCSTGSLASSDCSPSSAVTRLRRQASPNTFPTDSVSRRRAPNADQQPSPALARRCTRASSGHTSLSAALLFPAATSVKLSYGASGAASSQACATRRAPHGALGQAAGATAHPEESRTA